MQAAFTSSGTCGTGVASTSGTTISISATTNCGGGKVAVVVISSANINTTNNADNSEVSSVTDTLNGTWGKIGEITSTAGVAADGVTCSVWKSKRPPGSSATFTATVTMASSIVHRAASMWGFTPASATGNPTSDGFAVYLNKNVTTSNTAWGSVTVPSVGTATSKSWIAFRGLCRKANVTTAPTTTASYSAITTTRSTNNASAVYVSGEFHIATGTSDTSAPTMGTAGVNAAVFGYLEETFAGHFF